MRCVDRSSIGTLWGERCPLSMARVNRMVTGGDSIWNEIHGRRLDGYRCVSLWNVDGNGEIWGVAVDSPMGRKVVVGNNSGSDAPRIAIDWEHSSTRSRSYLFFHTWLFTARYSQFIFR